ncbi:type II secretion system protein J [Ketobacter sp.]|uniref:PulJ/GspJ family protein n=1 Tax=Ketobacter sp. TaxID=2083498 RepID=UPI000F0D4122|nr:type II secretion system protein [Ketobacter sp.]RLU01866.1 MAG: prepilin-type N-terminal cleavage/methylation domain-containing protein [Ketobacter sp.]
MKAILPAVKGCSGFTLVELIIVITLVGVVAVMASTIISQQMQGYVDTARRAELVGKADAALSRMARDLRNAVPHSIRVSGSAIEWVPISGFGRYRKFPTGGAGDVLDFSVADESFDVFGSVPAVAAGNRMVIANSAAAASGYNLYQAASDGSSLPLGSHVITATGVTLSAAAGVISLSTPFQFSQDSIASRFYIVDGAGSYVCNLSDGTLRRYQSYPLQSSQPTNTALAPLASAATALLVDAVSNCVFGYTALDQQHGLVTIELELSLGSESISLVRFIHVENRP